MSDFDFLFDSEPFFMPPWHLSIEYVQEKKQPKFNYSPFFQVCQWLLAQGMECYITIFMDHTITGDTLLSMDNNCLKELGVKNKEDREKIKKKIKELRNLNDKEKKALKKAEKQAGKKK